MIMSVFVRKMKHACAYFYKALKHIMLYPVAMVKYKNKGIYLISERGYDARDNGYHFFKYLAEYHPEIDAVYIASKDSPDYQKVSQCGKVVENGSVRHYLLFIAAEYLISTHIWGFSPDMEFYSRFYKKFKHFPVNGKKVFLQHGITKADLHQLYADVTDLDLFICGGEPEYHFVNDRYGYADGIVQYTGFARYDALATFKTKRQILIMPTWRMYLNDISREELKNSAYVRQWNSVLNNDKLLQIAEKNHLEILFYPHYEMQKNLDLFHCGSPFIKLASKNDYDVQDLLKTSKLLITDYSSVYFDFAYMGKPMVYYQFDCQDFHAHHYAEGYFIEQRDGFGPACTKESELIKLIDGYVRNDFTVEAVYEERMSHFFRYRDQNSCERILKAIQKL